MILQIANPHDRLQYIDDQDLTWLITVSKPRTIAWETRRVRDCFARRHQRVCGPDRWRGVCRTAIHMLRGARRDLAKLQAEQQRRIWTVVAWTKTDVGTEGHNQYGQRVAEILDRGRGFWAGRQYQPGEDKVVQYVSGSCLPDIQAALSRPFDDTKPVGQSKAFMVGIEAFQRGEPCPSGGDAYAGYMFAQAHYGS